MPYTLRGKITNFTPLTLDKTLTLEGCSADAKSVGDAIANAKEESQNYTNEHVNNSSNPHKVTASQVGLDNVDNTSDADKPVSTAQATAIADAKKAGTDAQTLANKAQTTADEAKTAAENAKTTANEAKTAAENAETNAKTYTDSLHKVFTAVLSADNWTGETAPYTQEVAVEGILETDTPHWGVVYSDNALAEKEAFAVVDDLDTADGSVTFTCLEEKPEVDLTIQLEVNR